MAKRALVALFGVLALVIFGSPVQAQDLTPIFVLQGVGAVINPTVMTSSPEPTARRYPSLGLGAQVDIAGKVSTGRWPFKKSWYWVLYSWTHEVEGPQVDIGFLQENDVSVTGGKIPELGVRGEYTGMSGDEVKVAGSLVIVEAATAIPVSPEPEVMPSPLPPTAVPQPQVAVGKVDIPWLPDTVQRWIPDIVAAADRHGVDPDLLAIITLVESGGGPDAGSSAGARGLTQVMPATGAGIAAQLGIPNFTADDLWIPQTALDFGAYYLAQQLATFGQAIDPDWQRSVELAAAAYNGGPGTVRSGRYAAETERYVRWVGGMWRERHNATSPTYQNWLNAGGRFLVDAARTS